MSPRALKVSSTSSLLGFANLPLLRDGVITIAIRKLVATVPPSREPLIVTRREPSIELLLEGPSPGGAENVIFQFMGTFPRDAHMQQSTPTS